MINKYKLADGALLKYSGSFEFIYKFKRIDEEYIYFYNSKWGIANPYFPIRSFKELEIIESLKTICQKCKKL